MFGKPFPIKCTYLFAVLALAWCLASACGYGVRYGPGRLRLDAQSGGSGASQPDNVRYLDAHSWMQIKNSSLDLSWFRLTNSHFAESTFAGEVNAHQAATGAQIISLQSVSAPEAELRMVGLSANLQQVITTLPVLSLRPYVGVGLGYIYKAEYDITAAYRVVSRSEGSTVQREDMDTFYTDYEGDGRTLDLVVGCLLFSRSAIAPRIEYRYQRTNFSFPLDLAYGERGPNRKVKGEGHLLLLEVVLKTPD